MQIRKAKISDVRDIQKLIENFASRGEMLPRALGEIYENMRDYLVCVDENGRILGVTALHIMWEDLAELRSLAVSPEYSGRGVGTKLVDACISEGMILGIKRIFALTYSPGYFKRFGFSVIDKSALPQKIWTDCLKCSKFPDCDETAVILRFENDGKSYGQSCR